MTYSTEPAPSESVIFASIVGASLPVYFVSPALAVLSLLLLRSYVKNVFRGFQFRGEDKYSHNTSDTAGSVAIVSKPVIENGFGEIKYKGTYFKAQADVYIPKDQTVKVIGKGDEQGSFLIVEKLNK